MAQDPMVQVIDRANPAPLAAFPFPNRKVGIKLEFCSGTGTWIIDRCAPLPSALLCSVIQFSQMQSAS